MTVITAEKPITLGETGLHLRLGGDDAYFNYFWLRDNAIESFDPETGERVFDIAALSGPPRAHAAHCAAGALVVTWDNGAETHMALDWLAGFHAEGRAPDPAALPRRLWHSGAYASWTRAAQPDILADPATRCVFARALIEDGIALVTQMPDTDEALIDLTRSLGPVTPSVDGTSFEVRLEIAPTNLAYTSKALELHTDLPNEEQAPGVQFLHCRANSVEGGWSLFSDGAAVAETLREEDPAAFDLLAGHKVPFFRRHNGWDYRAHQRVIECDASGAVSGVTISQHLADAFDLPQALLDSYYPAFVRFLGMLVSPRFLNRFRLEAGQCIVFDNHRIVHGREAFSAAQGKRHLRGCYTDRGALRSTYRTLCRQGHA